MPLCILSLLIILYTYNYYFFCYFFYHFYYVFTLSYPRRLSPSAGLPVLLCNQHRHNVIKVLLLPLLSPVVVVD